MGSSTEPETAQEKQLRAEQRRPFGGGRLFCTQLFWIYPATRPQRHFECSGTGFLWNFFGVLWGGLPQFASSGRVKPSPTTSAASHIITMAWGSI